jgi:hypothetical protein
MKAAAKNSENAVISHLSAGILLTRQAIMIAVIESGA